jgi:electron transfer flavoprotein alpha subunit
METILLLAHTNEDGSLAKASLEALAGAKQLAEKLGAKLSVGLIGKQVDAAANAVAGSGAAGYFGVEGAEFARARYATDAAAAEALCKAAGATIAIAPATSRWSRVIAGVAHRLEGRADTHVTGLEAADGAPRVTRWFYRQRMYATISRTHRPWLITLETGVFDAYAGAPGSASVEKVSVAVPATRTEVTGTKAPEAAQQTIRPDAKLLFVAGAGWTKKQRNGEFRPDAEQLILGFLDKSQASLGGSKSVVDQATEGQAVLKFMTHLNQVGQTGSTPRHPKGLATCCHGEEPHVVGWRFVNERRAVNLDPNCGWAHGKADVLYIADAFEVMKKVNELLS